MTCTGHQAIVLHTDADSARATARAGVGMFVGLAVYQNNLRRLGFDDSVFVPGGSERLIDAIVAWGDIDDVHARLRDTSMRAPITWPGRPGEQ
jgi:hypothetical protein